MSSAPSKLTVCPSCSYKHATPPVNARCSSCGASMEPLKIVRDAESDRLDQAERAASLVNPLSSLSSRGFTPFQPSAAFAP